MGRGFLPEDHRFGAAPVALVSYEYWRQYLGSPADLSAIKLRISGSSGIGDWGAARGISFSGWIGDLGATRIVGAVAESNGTQLAGHRTLAGRYYAGAGARRTEGRRASNQAAVWPGCGHDRCGSGAAAGCVDRECAGGPVDSDGSGRISAADCVRQCCEPLAGAGFNSREGIGDSSRDRRRARTFGAAVSYGVVADVAGRGSACGAGRAVGYRGTGAFCSRGNARAGRGQHSSAGLAVCVWNLAAGSGWAGTVQR